MIIEEVSLVSANGANERSLAATYFEPENPNGSSVLFLSGYRSVRQKYMRYAVALGNTIGTSSLTLDIGGHGESDGALQKLTSADHLQDALIAFDYLKTRPNIQPERIGVTGTSYGGYLALLLCRTRTPKSLFLGAPMVHEVLPEDLVTEATDLNNEDLRSKLMSILPENSVLRALGEFKGGVTVVEYERDQSVRPESIQACVTAARNSQHKIIRGASHVLKDEERLVFQEMLTDWAVEL